MLRALVLASVLPLCAAAEPVEEAREAARGLELAVALVDAARGEDRIAALTGAIRAMEDGLAALREGMRRVAAREARVEARLGVGEDRLEALTASLMRMGRAPAPALALHPDGPLETARAGMLAAGVVPALRAEADAVRAELAELAAIRALQESAIGTLEEGLAGLSRARSELALALRERREAPRLLDDPQMLAALAAASDTLDGFAAAFAPDPGAPADLPKGEIALPVPATLLRGFEEPDARGVSRPGASLAVAAGALVTAPLPGTIRYAGPLPGYDNVIVLEPEAGSLVVLGGLGMVYDGAGRIVRAGDPLGLMGGDVPDAAQMMERAASGAGAERDQTLYIETREGGEPVDPATWFAL